MATLSERFELRLDKDILKRIDLWRSGQNDQPTRAEAMRRLVELGLTTTSSDTMNFSDGERLLAMMLRDIYRQLDIEEHSNEIDPDFVLEAIQKGHTWALRSHYSWLFEEPVNPRSVRFVCDVMNMWTVIEQSCKSLLAKDLNQIKRDAGPYGTDLKFRGFDGNDESEYWSIATFLIKNMGRFSIFDGRDLNCACSMVERYTKMLTAFETLRGDLWGRHLTSSEVVKLLKAQGS